MSYEIQNLFSQYLTWLKEKTSFKEVEGWTEITTPFLDRHNDYLQIFAKSENGGFVLTDAGYVLDDLKMCGCKIESPKRQSLLKMTLNGFGILLEGDQLLTHATKENFSLKKHSLIQAMLSVNDLFYLAQPIVASLFLEDVTAWLDLHEVRYTPKVKFTGKSGYDHSFDFVIPKSKKEPERIVQAINRAAKDTAQNLIFAWYDTKEVRSPDSRAYALLNDQEHELQSSVLDAFKNYEVIPVRWSQRETVLDRLAA